MLLLPELVFAAICMKSKIPTAWQNPKIAPKTYGLLPESEIAKIKGKKELAKAASNRRKKEHLLLGGGGDCFRMCHAV